MSDGWLERFAESVCGYSVLFWYLLWFNVAFLLLGTFAWQYVTPGTASRWILVFDLGINVTMILTMGVLIGYCRRKR